MQQMPGRDAYLDGLLAHGAFRAETAGMKVSFTISAAASTAKS